MLKKVFESEYVPPHPGEILREDYLPSIAMTRAALARHLGISRRMLGDLLNERRPISFDLAQRLGGALGTGTRYWIGLQAQHDVWLAERSDAPRILPVAWRPKVTPGVLQGVNAVQRNTRTTRKPKLKLRKVSVAPSR